MVRRSAVHSHLQTSPAACVSVRGSDACWLVLHRTEKRYCVSLTPVSSVHVALMNTSLPTSGKVVVAHRMSVTWCQLVYNLLMLQSTQSSADLHFVAASLSTQQELTTCCAMQEGGCCACCVKSTF